MFSRGYSALRLTDPVHSGGVSFPFTGPVRQDASPRQSPHRENSDINHSIQLITSSTNISHSYCFDVVLVLHSSIKPRKSDSVSACQNTSTLEPTHSSTQQCGACKRLLFSDRSSLSPLRHANQGTRHRVDCSLQYGHLPRPSYWQVWWHSMMST